MVQLVNGVVCRLLDGVVCVVGQSSTLHNCTTYQWFSHLHSTIGKRRVNGSIIYIAQLHKGTIGKAGECRLFSWKA